MTKRASRPSAEGKVSPTLAYRCPPGTPLIITGFTGPFTLSEKLREGTDTVIHACAGSGVVPSMSIIKAGLRNDDAMRHVLLYSNKTVEDTIYLELLREMERDYPERFEVHFFFTRIKQKPTFSPHIALGRINQAAVEAVLNSENNPLVFVCGPANTPLEKKPSPAGSHHPIEAQVYGVGAEDDPYGWR